MLTKLMTVLLLMAALVPMKAQATTPTWSRVAGQSDWVTGLPAGSVIAWGDGTHFSSTATTSAAKFPASGFEASSAQFLPIPALTGPAGLYVQQGSATVALTVVTFATQKSATVTVPAISVTPPAATTYATTCSTVVGPTGAINIILTATPSN